MRRDTALAVGAARALQLVRSDEWPLVAAWLLADGADGDALAELAGLSRGASGWEVDQLLDRALVESGVPQVPVEEAGLVAARTLAQAMRTATTVIYHPIIRALARLSPALDYPSGSVGTAYYAEDWLDCDCHRASAERDEADRLEAEWEALAPLDIDDRLAAALSLTALAVR